MATTAEELDKAKTEVAKAEAELRKAKPGEEWLKASTNLVKARLELVKAAAKRRQEAQRCTEQLFAYTLKGYHRPVTRGW